MKEPRVKVAIIGNMNNNNFSITRYLRDVGYDVTLFITNEHSHFHPSMDTFTDTYTEYVRKLNWTKDNFNQVDVREIQSVLKDFNVFMGCGIAPAYLSKAKIQLDVFIPYGGDLYRYPYYGQNLSIRGRLSLLKGRLFNKDSKLKRKTIFSEYQRSGIKNAGHIMLGESTYQNELKRLGVESKWKRVSIPMVHLNSYDNATINEGFKSWKYASILQKFRKSSDVLVLHHCRLFWKITEDFVVNSYSNRGNDRFIRAFAKLIEENSKKKLQLAIVEYGPDVDSTKELIKELGIEDRVLWLPLMSRKEIMLLLSIVDFAVDAVTVSGIGGGTTLETIAMGKPILRHRDDQKHLDYESEIGLYPLMNASSENEIFRVMQEYVDDPGKFKKYGEISKKWYINVIVSKSILFLSKVIDQKKVVNKV